MRFSVVVSYTELQHICQSSPFPSVSCKFGNCDVILLLEVFLNCMCLLQFSYCIDEQDILSDLMIINKVCGGKSLAKTSQLSMPSLNHAGDVVHDVSVEDGRLCYEKRWQVF